ncbi:MAG: hypothetical protein WCL50_01330 [Spirochaetota bacterium]
MRAAATVMLYRGLRVGALRSLVIRSGRFTAQTKGKAVSGAMPEAALEEIREAGLPAGRPFEGAG